MNRLKQYLPILDWLPQYKKSYFKGDLSAGLTVGVMLIPQGMAYAMIAGLPPQYGLFTAIVPLFIYAIFGTSRQLAVGPVALVSLLTAATVSQIATPGSEAYISMAITLALMVGLIELTMGLFKLGYLVNFLSHPVISGFTSAAALIIGLSQLKHILGIKIPRGLKVHEIVITAFEQSNLINWTSFWIGLAGIGIIIGLKKINRAIPGSLIAVFFGILVTRLLHLGADDIKLVGNIPNALPSFKTPEISWDLFKEMFPLAAALALVGFMESIAVAKSLQAKHKDYKVDSNQELIALGLASIGGSFFQSYTVEGGFGRSAVNDQAGAKTGIAAMISAVMVILALLFLTPFFYDLPKAILGSIIMVAVVGLIDFHEVKVLWKQNRRDLMMLIVTFLGTLILGVEEGIGLGVILSLAMVIYRTTRPHVAVLGNVPDTHFYRNVERFKGLKVKDEVLIIRFDAQLYFANSEFFKEQLAELTAEKGDKLKLIILNAESINYLDSSAVHAIKDVVEEYRKKGIEIAFSGVKGPVRDAMSRAEILTTSTGRHFFMSVQEAVDCYESSCLSFPKDDHEDLEDYVMQANKR